MTTSSFGFRMGLTLVALFILLTSTAIARSAQGPATVSPEEQKLIDAVAVAPDPAGKLKAAAVLLKKFPKSAQRTLIGRDMVRQIEGVADAAQKLSLAQEYQTLFNEPSEQELAVRLLINVHSAAQRPDDAFAAGSGFLAKNPDAVRVLVVLMLLGTDQAKAKNVKFVPQSLQYGARAIELLETDKKPADMDFLGWAQYRTVLPGMYQSMGVLSMFNSDMVEARNRLTKAAELAPTDPFNYLFLAGVLNEEYKNNAKRYMAMPDGQAKTDELQKVLLLLDKVIDAQARMIALSEGNQRLAQVRQQYLQDLESYYKYRHNGSTEGLQQLIDKYKPAPKP